MVTQNKSGEQFGRNSNKRKVLLIILKYSVKFFWNMSPQEITPICVTIGHLIKVNKQGLLFYVACC